MIKIWFIASLRRLEWTGKNVPEWNLSSDFIQVLCVDLSVVQFTWGYLHELKCHCKIFGKSPTRISLKISKAELETKLTKSLSTIVTVKVSIWNYWIESNIKRTCCTKQCGYQVLSPVWALWFCIWFVFKCKNNCKISNRKNFLTTFGKKLVHLFFFMSILHSYVI